MTLTLLIKIFISSIILMFKGIAIREIFNWELTATVIIGISIFTMLAALLAIIWFIL